MYTEIVDFAELHAFMGQKLKNYSSGMQVRLAFSIAIKAQGDILILDEVLAVGDEAFQRKCNDYFEQIRKDAKKTVVLVTHDMQSIKKYCNKALLINNGEIAIVGKPEDVSNGYIIDSFEPKNYHKVQKTKIKIIPKSPPVLTSTDTLRFAISYTQPKGIKTYIRIKISIMSSVYNAIEDELRNITPKNNKITVEYKYNLYELRDCDFKVLIGIYDSSSDELIMATKMDDGLSFAIRNSGEHGLLQHRGEWS
jgi:ABC-2 type transport system ATP-binding protein